MLVVTAGSDNYLYHLTINYCRGKCIDYGYKFRVYDLGGLDFGIKVDDPRCVSKFRIVRMALKPEIILDTLQSTSERTVLWIDGDATLIKPVNELDTDDSFDVGLTVRNKTNKKRTEYINAGILFFKNNGKAKDFLKRWIEAMPPVPDLTVDVKPANYCEQAILEEKILLPNINVIPWDAFNTVHEIFGTRVKFFDCATYNNFNVVDSSHWEAGPGDAKIIHFKGHKMHRIIAYHHRHLSE